MRKLLLAAVFAFLPTVAFGQCTGIFADKTVCGNTSGAASFPRPVELSSVLSNLALTQYHFFIGNAANTPVDTALSGDCTNSSSYGIVCAKLSGVSITLSDTVHLPPIAQGDVWFGSAAGTISSLTKDTSATRYIANTGSSNNPAWAQVDLSDGVTGNLSTVHLNSGLSATSETFWRGDGTWQEVSVYYPPGGRLILETNSCAGEGPIQNTDITAATVVCYVPYTSNRITINDTNLTFSTLTLTLDATNHVNTNLYSVWAINNSGSVVLCTSAAWTNTTTRADAIGANGLGQQVNSAELTNCYNNSVNYGPIVANAAIELGAIRIAGANGQTRWNLRPARASGGTNNILGVCNNYNTVYTAIYNGDSTSTWTAGTAGTWATMNASTNNRIAAINCLGQETYRYHLEVSYTSSANDIEAVTVAVCVDCTTTATTDNQVFNQGGTDAINQGSTLIAHGVSAAVGYHFFQAMENGQSTGTGMTLHGNTYGGLYLFARM